MCGCVVVGRGHPKWQEFGGTWLRCKRVTGLDPEPHLSLRRARTDARSDAATSGPRPAPTTISTVVRLSASSCAAATPGQLAVSSRNSTGRGADASLADEGAEEALSACARSAPAPASISRSAPPLARGPAGSGTQLPRRCCTSCRPAQTSRTSGSPNCPAAAAAGTAGSGEGRAAGPRRQVGAAASRARACREAVAAARCPISCPPTSQQVPHLQVVAVPHLHHLLLAGGLNLPAPSQHPISSATGHHHHLEHTHRTTTRTPPKQYNPYT